MPLSFFSDSNSIMGSFAGGVASPTLDAGEVLKIMPTSNRSSRRQSKKVFILVSISLFETKIFAKIAGTLLSHLLNTRFLDVRLIILVEEM